MIFDREEIPLGHSERKKLVPLVNQRVQHENRVNEALIGGIVLRKEHPDVSHSLFNFAHEQRTKSQKTQRAIDHVKAEGYVDRKAALMRISERHRESTKRKRQRNQAMRAIGRI